MAEYVAPPNPKFVLDGDGDRWDLNEDGETYRCVGGGLQDRTLARLQDDWGPLTFDDREHVAPRLERQDDPSQGKGPQPPSPREVLLAEAAELITGDRNKTYGTPTQNFQNTADLWNVQLRHKLKDGELITAGDVAALMIHLKLARMIAQHKKDNWLDIVGYGACGFEAELNDGALE